MIDHEPGSSGGSGRHKESNSARDSRVHNNGQSQRSSPSSTAQHDERLTAGSQSLPDDDSDLGDALRTIYQQTVDEEIPAEMLDLLKRLD